jgi:hypothetical protein
MLWALPLLLGAGAARAQSLVNEVPEDPCQAARGLDFTDTSPDAEHLRRSCRLQRFENRLESERGQQVAVEEQAREERVQQWIEATQPSRVTHPMAIEGFVGSGLASYGFAVSWDFLRRWEVGGWIGWRPISCSDNNGNTNADCGRTAFGLRGRWYLSDHDFTPFVASGLSLMTSNLALCPSYGCNSSNYTGGTGRANSLNAGAGLALGIRSFRASLEYVFEYTFYTGTSLNDAKKTPSPALNTALSESLRGDRNGVRFQMGYAF